MVHLTFTTWAYNL